MKLKVSEHDTQTAILDWLKQKGIFHWRSNTGSFAGEYKGKKRFVRFGIKGAPDIFAVVKGGRLVGIEVKAPGKKPTADQESFGDNLTVSGALYIVAHSLDDAIAGFEQAKKEFFTIIPHERQDAARNAIEHVKLLQADLDASVKQAQSDTWAHVFQGVDEPCGCENHIKLRERIDARVPQVMARSTSQPGGEETK